MTTRRTVLLGLTALAGGLPGMALAAPAAPKPTSAEKAGVDKAAAPPNTMTLRDVSGAGAKDYPVYAGRPFVQGEIMDAPQAVLGGAKLLTQATVMTRWPDGSVQHAIMAFVVPRVPPGGTLTIGFANQPQPSNTPLTTAQMLDPAFDFDAAIQIAANGETRSASARAMLQAGDVTVWTAGPVATTVVIADHSAARKHDMGFDALRSVRPLFHATFWPGLRKVQVRAIGENANTETLQDVQYDLTLTAGAAKPAEVFRQDAVPHYAATRWARTFWLGGPPNAVIDVDHNLRYLAATRAFPNFDTSLQVPEQSIAQTYAAWQKAPKGLYDAGGWTKYMPTTGGRDDIGPYPGPVTKWLFTGDHRLFEMVAGMAELAGAWPMHVREGNPAKTFDPDHKVPAIGRPLSVFARPSLWLFDERDRSRPEDRVAVQGARIVAPSGPKYGGGWIADGAHQPDPYSAFYTLTGDPFALEQLQFWAAIQALRYDPEYRGVAASGGFLDQVRGCAWVLRTRVHAAFLSPGASPEKAYFNRLTEDALAYWEGHLGLHGSRFEGSKLWQAGQSRAFSSPLHLLRDQPAVASEGIDIGRAKTEIALWQHYMLIFELGRAKEKGFFTGPLLSWLAAVLTGQFQAGPEYSPYNLQRYYTPVRDAQGGYFRTWADTLTGYKDPNTPDRFNTDVHDGYGAYAYAASTMITGEPGGAEAYAWLREKGYQPLRQHFAEYPKWAFLPRA